MICFPITLNNTNLAEKILIIRFFRNLYTIVLIMISFLVFVRIFNLFEKFFSADFRQKGIFV